MSGTIKVEFGTERLRDIPTIGQRRRVRVNGRIETKYVKSVRVEAVKFLGDPLYYRGEYVLTDSGGLWG